MTDRELHLIADYTKNATIDSAEAYATARLCLADALGCALLSLKFPDCTKLLGPVVPGATVPHGSRIPGTSYILDPIRAAFNISTMIRWLDYNDTWLGAEWAHPSDNIGGILAVTDFLNRQGKFHYKVRDIIKAMIKAYEIQGSLAILNSFNKRGFDHVILVKVATAAVTTALLGGDENQIVNALSNALIDAGPLRTYRHAPNTGSRKSWSAGDQCSRGVMFAWMSMQGEMGYHQALSAKQWGFNDIFFPLVFQRPLGSYVMENILFKISYPAEFHAQTAVEAAVLLHPTIKRRLRDIESIEIHTQEAGARIIDKTGTLHNHADRDHCIQYMTAIALLKGNLQVTDYDDKAAQDPLVDFLREKMHVVKEDKYTVDYHDPDKRAIANALTITFKDGSKEGPVVVDYPIGHRRRRDEGIPLLKKKFKDNLATHFSRERVGEIAALFEDHQQLEEMPVDEFINLFV